MNEPTILVVAAEMQIRRVLRTTLSGKYEVIEARSGKEAIKAVIQEHPDLILLDVNMPGMNGFEACCKIRLSFDGPIIMVMTVRSSEQDKIVALDSGADDFVVKPFAMGELLARIRAALRRVSPRVAVTRIDLPDLSIDLEKRIVEARGKKVYLPPRQFDVLRLLVIHQGKPLTHKALLYSAWGPEHGEEIQNLRVVISQLRKKIEKNPAHPRYILTDPRVGYRLNVSHVAAEKRPASKPHLSG